MKEYFLLQGFDEQHLSTELWRVLNITRETCLQTKQKQDNPAHIRLVVILAILFYYPFTRLPKDTC